MEKDKKKMWFPEKNMEMDWDFRYLPGLESVCIIYFANYNWQQCVAEPTVWFRLLGNKVDLIAARYQPVRDTFVGAVHVVHRAGAAYLSQSLVGHAVDISLRVDQVREVCKGTLTHRTSLQNSYVVE